MSKEYIVLTPNILKEQSASLKTLSDDYNNFFTSFTNDLKKINLCWSYKLANNFEKKITAAQKVASTVVFALELGSEKASAIALKFEEADKINFDVASIDREDANAITKQREKLTDTIKTEGNTYYSLQNYMSISFKQGNYNMIVHDPKGNYNGGCLATCYAIGGSIVTGQSRSPMDYWNSKSELANKGYGDAQVNVSGEIAGGEESFKTIYDHVISGKPVIIHFTHQNIGKQHYVVVTGVSSTAKVDALSKSDFIVADPGTGKYRSLDNCMSSYSHANVIGYRMFN